MKAISSTYVVSFVFLPQGQTCSTQHRVDLLSEVLASVEVLNLRVVSTYHAVTGLMLIAKQVRGLRDKSELNLLKYKELRLLCSRQPLVICHNNTELSQCPEVRP